MAFSKISVFFMLVILAACGADDKPSPTITQLALAGMDWSGALRCPPAHLFMFLGKTEVCISYTLPTSP